MIHRDALKELEILASQFKCVGIIGPRQSGKTTLCKLTFPHRDYVSLENPDTRIFADEDPRGFLSNYPNGAILDEIQRVPKLFSYLQQILDESNEPGFFILTGSNNFLLQESISQSLAGRIGYINLLPLAIHEIIPKGYESQENYSDLIVKGFFPPVHDQNLDPVRWHQNYIRTYVEKDVRQIKNILQLNLFEKFLRLCAGRIGQLLNANSLAIEIGVDNKTISSWIGVLESSFVIFLLRPHHRSFNKRIVKMPKLYFIDTGVASSLLGIRNKAHLDTHPLKGNLFENLIVSDLLKTQYNLGVENRLYFWRDNVGHELDGLIDSGNKLHPIEIKSGQTITSDYFKGLSYWEEISKESGGTIFYGGNTPQKRSSGVEIHPWFDCQKIVHLFD
ncbi:ATP-binding protein [Algoriphagus antarcticus]|uniref:AAA+ ATPase domain-containing protein n=1 Tax=Algoriphagus antarcticus TaxID=238540 RepID=A0A3E0DFZ6_9BACT|nr:ATP-binding protein [Algoriphagus antarcticus]REG81509.1 hypothetical protein C8N25_12613 [Algoriphagus antarcticus]